MRAPVLIPHYTQGYVSPQRVSRICYCAIARGENPSGLRRDPSDRVCAPPSIHRCNDPVRYFSLAFLLVTRRNIGDVDREEVFRLFAYIEKGEILFNSESD